MIQKKIIFLHKMIFTSKKAKSYNNNMKTYLLNMWQMLIHTCVFQPFSIVSGSLLTFATIAWMSMYHPMLTTMWLCPLFVLGIYFSIALINCKILHLMKRYDLKCYTLGFILGFIWIMFLAFV